MDAAVTPSNIMGKRAMSERFVDKINQLYNRSEDKDTDTSSFVNQIVKDYSDVYKIKHITGLYHLPEFLLAEIVSQLTENELSELAQDIAKNDILKISLMLKDKSMNTLPLRVVRIWLNESKFHYQYGFIGNGYRITIKHNLGPKYSYLLKEIGRYIFEVAFESRSLFDIKDSAFFLTLTVNSFSSIIKEIRQLEIADGLKKLLVETGFTMELINLYGSQGVSEILNIDNEIGKLISKSAQNIIEK